MTLGRRDCAKAGAIEGSEERKWRRVTGRILTPDAQLTQGFE
jgi:hypothetical protein